MRWGSRAAALVAVAVTCLGAARARAGAAPAYHVPDPIVRRLDNGLTVAVFRDARLPLVHVQVAVAAGSATEGAGQYGAAHAVSELVGYATTSRDADALRDDLARAGGTLSTQLGRDVVLLGGTFLAGELGTALEVTSDCAINAVFNDSDAERVLRATRLAVQRSTDPDRQGEDGLWNSLFGTGPYGRPPVGTADALSALKLEDLRDFYHAHWTPRGAVLAIAGDVSPDDAFAKAAEWFGRWPVRDSVVAPPAGPVAARSARVLDRTDVPRCPVYVGVRGPRAGDLDEIPMALAVQLATREPGGLVGLRGSQTALRDGGMVWLAAEAPIDSAGIVARALEARLLALREAAPDAATLADLERGVTLAFPMRFETLAGLAGQWCANAVLGFAWSDLAAFPDRVARITPERLRDAARRTIDRDRVATVIVGPLAKIDVQAQGLGPAVGVEAGGALAPSPAEERRGRELVARAIAAHGGLAKLKGLHDSTLEADVTLDLPGRSMTGTLEQVRREPARMLLVTKLTNFSARQVLDDQRAWTTPLDSAWVMIDADPTTVASLRQGFRSDVPHVLIDAAAATRLAARGRDTLGGQAVENVEAWGPANTHRTLFLDPQTSLLVGIEQREPGLRTGDVVTVRRVYRDIRPVQGLKMPFAEERWLEGRRAMDLHYTRVAFDTGVAESLFERGTPPLPPTTR